MFFCGSSLRTIFGLRERRVTTPSPPSCPRPVGLSLLFCRRLVSSPPSCSCVLKREELQPAADVVPFRELVVKDKYVALQDALQQRDQGSFVVTSVQQLLSCGLLSCRYVLSDKSFVVPWCFVRPWSQGRVLSFLQRFEFGVQVKEKDVFHSSV